MNDDPATLGKRFRFNDGLIDILAEGMDDADWSARPPGGGNSAHWILAHLCAARRSLLRKLGEDVATEPWEASFGKGGEPGDGSVDPPVELLLSTMKDAGGRLGARLASLGPDEARAEWGSAFPDGSTTVTGGAGFLFFHESYHLGQLGLLRRMRGKPRFA